ncbi:21028_t:CDS:10 [Entrophospora sp. SA101]|nr:21028_t:CDS:10 [Entrophospora sp. SA101]
MLGIVKKATISILILLALLIGGRTIYKLYKAPTTETQPNEKERDWGDIHQDFKNNPELIEEWEKENEEEIKTIDKVIQNITDGSGKSTLANVLLNKNGNFEEVFKTSHSGISETEKVQTAEFVEDGVNYRIIDTVGIFDNRLTQEELIEKIVYAVAATVPKHVRSEVAEIFQRQRRYTEISKEKREISRQKLLSHLATCQDTYHPTNLDNLKERIDKFMTREKLKRDGGNSNTFKNNLENDLKAKFEKTEKELAEKQQAEELEKKKKELEEQKKDQENPEIAQLTALKNQTKDFFRNLEKMCENGFPKLLTNDDYNGLIIAIKANKRIIKSLMLSQSGPTIIRAADDPNSPSNDELKELKLSEEYYNLIEQYFEEAKAEVKKQNREEKTELVNNKNGNLGTILFKQELQAQIEVLTKDRIEIGKIHEGSIEASLEVINDKVLIPLKIKKLGRHSEKGENGNELEEKTDQTIGKTNRKNNPKEKKLKNYYDILEVKKDASEEEIKAAYKRMSRKYHPDKATKNGLTTEEATEKFQELHTAYEELTEQVQKQARRKKLSSQTGIIALFVIVEFTNLDNSISLRFSA